MSVRDTIRKAKPTLIEHTLTDGSRIWIRALSGTGRANYSAYIEKAKENGGIHSEVIAAFAICEEDGTLAYDWTSPEHIAEIGDHLDGQDLEQISLKLFRVSGLSKTSMEDAAKNSEASPNDSSGSSSPPTSSTQP